MKKILVMCFCLILIGGLMMPAQAFNFTICLETPEEGKDVNVFLDTVSIGKTNEEGIFILETNIIKKGKIYNLTFKKEGYLDFTIWVQRDEENYFYGIKEDNSDRHETNKDIKCGFGYVNYKIHPEPTLEAVTPAPTITLTPIGYKTPEERLPELENAIAEHETKISWLEGKIKAILDWVKDKFGDIL